MSDITKYKKREYPGIIPQETVNKWKLQREWGDVKCIQQYAFVAGKKLTRQAVMNALRGFAKLSTMEIIESYYEEKKSSIKVENQVLEVPSPGSYNLKPIP